MNDDTNITRLPTGYTPDESVPRSEIETVQQQIMILVDEIQLLSKGINAVLKYLRAQSKGK